jgi:hypothetical protein
MACKPAKSNRRQVVVSFAQFGYPRAHVIPAKAGIHSAFPVNVRPTGWIPAFAGMTVGPRSGCPIKRHHYPSPGKLLSRRIEILLYNVIIAS